MGNGTEVGEVKAIIAELEGRAADLLAQYHRLQGAIDTWQEIRQAMVQAAIVERSEEGKKAVGVADG